MPGREAASHPSVAFLWIFCQIFLSRASRTSTGLVLLPKLPFKHVATASAYALPMYVFNIGTRVLINSSLNCAGEPKIFPAISVRGTQKPNSRSTTPEARVQRHYSRTPDEILFVVSGIPDAGIRAADWVGQYWLHLS